MENYLQTKWHMYCSEAISNIENYEKALLDPTNYIVHHRLGEIVNSKVLISHDLYYNRPAKELIFLTKSQHASLHGRLSGWHTAQKGKKRTEEEINKMLLSREHNKIYKNCKVLCLTNNTLYINASAAMRDLGLTTTCNIHKCCRKERKSTAGYEFRYYI